MKPSSYKTPADRDWIVNWTGRVLQNSVLDFKTTYVPSTFGKTCVYTYLQDRTDLPVLCIMPGMRTSGMYWVLNNNLTMFKDKCRIFIFDNIGQPGLSDGTNPHVKNNEYGMWMNEVLGHLGISKAYWMGASFGCQLIVKLSQVAPGKIEKAVFICPGGIVQIGMTWKNLSANMFIMWFKSEKSNKRFMQNVVYGPQSTLTGKAHDLLSESILETVKRFDMRTGYPYPMKKAEFANMTMPVLVLPGGNDPMFAPERLLPQIKKVFPVQPQFEPLPGHGHGGEVSPVATQKAFDFFFG